MADQATSLPVRSEADGTDERVQTKIVDATNPDTQQMEVDTDNNAHVEVHGNRADDAADVVLQLSEEGKANGRGDYEVDDNSEPNSAGLVAGIRSANNLATDQTEHISSIEDGGGTVRALDISLHDEAGEAFSSSNPLPVVIDNPGNCEDAFKTAAAVVKDASDIHTFSPAADSQLKMVVASASGKIRVEIKAGVAASETTRMVLFNSTANPNIEFVPRCGIALLSTDNVLVEITNLDNQDQDVYSHIEVQAD